MNAIAKEAAQSARFTKIGPAGEVLPSDAPEWDAVLDSRTGLMWTVKFVRVKNGHEKTLADALATLQGTAGFDDWQLPATEPLYALADHTRVEPAIDTEFFPDCPADWFWTSTPDCESPSFFAWGVYFVSGSSHRSGRGFDGFVRAVRVGQ